MHQEESVMAHIYTSAHQLIGHTPLLELTHIEEKLGLKAKILAKTGAVQPRRVGEGPGGPDHD